MGFIYDGDFLHSHKNEFERDLKGAVVIGDSHFTAGEKIFSDDLKFYTNYRITTDRDDEHFRASRDREIRIAEEIREKSTIDQVKFNTGHRKARARIEKPFAWIKQKFAYALNCLSKPWNEPPEQMDCVVMFASALHNTQHPSF